MEKRSMVFEHNYKDFPELTNAQLNDLEFSSPHVQIKEDFVATVVKVHDGDTITVRTDFRDFDFPVRLLDIDAPELSEGGVEARDWLKNKVLGQQVTILVDSSNRVGKYGRLLGRLQFGGLDVGQQMLYLGLVSEFGERDSYEVPTIYHLLQEVKYNAFV